MSTIYIIKTQCFWKSALIPSSSASYLVNPWKIATLNHKPATVGSSCGLLHHPLETIFFPPFAWFLGVL